LAVFISQEEVHQMLREVEPGWFESDISGRRFEELSVEYDRDIEVRWLFDEETASVRLHLRPAAPRWHSPCADQELVAPVIRTP
jgi:hypothetical protein